MKTRSIRTGACLVIVGLFLSLIPGPGSTAETAWDPSQLSPGVRVGTAAPEFTLPDKDGKWVSLSDYRGRKVLLFSWSTWCRCKYQLPALERFYQEHKGPGFEIVAVAADSQGFKWVSKYVSLAGVTFPVLIDPMIDLQDKYHFSATENAWLIDEAGVVRYNQIGFDVRRGEQRQALLEAMRLPAVAGAPPEKKPLAERVVEQERKVKAMPWSERARFDLADLQLQSGDLSGAALTLAEAVKRRPMSAEAHYRLGVIAYQQDMPGVAVTEWQRAYDLEPTNYIYYRNVQAYKDPDKFYKELTEGKYPPK